MRRWFGAWDGDRVRRWKRTLSLVVSVALVASVATYGATAVARTREAEELAAIGLLEEYLAILDRADRNSRDPRDFKSLLKQLEADEAVPAWSRALSDYVRGRQIRGTWP